MAANRFTQMFSDPASRTPAQPQGVPVGFALCPIFVVQVQGPQQANPLHELYRLAYEQRKQRRGSRSSRSDSSRFGTKRFQRP